MTELEDLARAAGNLAAAAGARSAIGERASSLADRLAHNRFNISVVGEFKRGKSTLVNAMLGVELMPTGVLPLTSVATEVAFGDLGATIVYLDGHTEAADPGQLAGYVTEAGNPANTRGVARAEVRLPVELLRPGVVLVDTPGLGSVFQHDEAAARALLEADGAIVVLSADAPLSEDERRILSDLAEREAATFFVLNRADHLDAAELEEVAHFVNVALMSELGRSEHLWCLSARAALAARVKGVLPDVQTAGEFTAFFQAFSRFVRDDLVSARATTARAELARLARELKDTLAIEAANSAIDAAALRARVDRLEAAANIERRAFDDERVLLEHNVALLARSLGAALHEFGATRPERFEATLAQVATGTPPRRLEDALRSTVKDAVTGSFEEVRQSIAKQAETGWAQLAERFRSSTQDRVNSVREAAADIFEVHLPRIELPRVVQEKERFSYLFIHVGTSTEPLDRLLRWVMPPSVARRRLLRTAQRELASEFDKHAGRARWDLEQRLDGVRRRLEVAMAQELEQSVQTIVAAARAAQEVSQMAEADRLERQRRDAIALEAASAALAVVGSR